MPPPAPAARGSAVATGDVWPDDPVRGSPLTSFPAGQGPLRWVVGFAARLCCPPFCYVSSFIRRASVCDAIPHTSHFPSALCSLSTAVLSCLCGEVGVRSSDPADPIKITAIKPTEVISKGCAALRVRRAAPSLRPQSDRAAEGATEGSSTVADLWCAPRPWGLIVFFLRDKGTTGDNATAAFWCGSRLCM